MGDILNISRSLSLHGVYMIFKSVVKVGLHTTLAYSINYTYSIGGDQLYSVKEHKDLEILI